MPAFVARWLDQDLFGDLREQDAEIDARLANTAPGLADSLRSAGAGTQVASWGRLGQLSTPTLVVAGSTDAKFAALGRRMVDALPDGHLELIPGAGHACHLVRPAATASVIERWLG